jgi:ribonuclease BN (tRNA processing enzyme)
MKFFVSILLSLLCNTVLIGYANAGTTQCPPSEGLSLQILGSGGPIADDGRASTSYLIWIDGKSRLMIDSGGGSFLRFAQATGNFESLDHIGISHFHTDHSTDLVALLKSGYFSDRTGKLTISGPTAGGPYPGLTDYLARLLDANTGAYAYLSAYLDGSGGLVKLEPIEIDPRLHKASLAYKHTTDDIEVFALGVPHGPVPALAFRINIGQKSIVFSGDQNGSSEAFVDFAREADVLVMHMPVPETISGAGRNLHAPPSLIGDIAAKANSRLLVLSHFMTRSLDQFDDSLKEIRSRYPGPLASAHDLECVNF